jgi:hypothetical protein
MCYVMDNVFENKLFYYYNLTTVLALYLRQFQGTASDNKVAKYFAIFSNSFERWYCIYILLMHHNLEA